MARPARARPPHVRSHPRPPILRYDSAPERVHRPGPGELSLAPAGPAPRPALAASCTPSMGLVHVPSARDAAHIPECPMCTGHSHSLSDCVSYYDAERLAELLATRTRWRAMRSRLAAAGALVRITREAGVRSRLLALGLPADVLGHIDLFMNFPCRCINVTPHA